MHEIVEAGAVGRLFALCAWVVPLAGGLVGVAAGLRRGQPARGLVVGLAVGLIGTLNWLLWLTYNAITDRLGLDTVVNLAVNVALFVVFGAVVGAVAGRMAPRQLMVRPVATDPAVVQGVATGASEPLSGGGENMDLRDTSLPDSELRGSAYDAGSVGGPGSSAQEHSGK